MDDLDQLVAFVRRQADATARVGTYRLVTVVKEGSAEYRDSTPDEAEDFIRRTPEYHEHVRRKMHRASPA